MKTTLSRITSIAALSLATVTGYAADGENKKTDRSAYPERRSAVHSTGRFGHPAKVSEIIGAEVRGVQDEKIGRIDELALDMESGRVAQAIISSGGVLGVGANNWAVPPGALSFDAPSKTFRLNSSSEKLKAAPVFEMSKWDEASQSNQVMEVYRYYEQHPYFVDNTSVRENNLRRADNIPDDKYARARLNQLEKASKVIGLPVMNKQNEKLGNVDSLIVDLPAGRIVHVVVSSGGFLGIGDALSAVPPSAFRYAPSRDSLQLDISKNELTQAPHFKSSEWSSLNDQNYAARVYRSYGVEPYFKDADNTARNVRDRQESRLTPTDQGNSAEDVRITREIRKEIMAQEGFSINARNVKVITANGRVTLRGPVNTEQEKQVIAEIANRIALKGNVDNQIETTRQPYKE